MIIILGWLFFPQNQSKTGINNDNDNNNNYYYMAKPVLGKSVHSDWFFLGLDFAVQTIAVETVEAIYFCFGAKLANSNFATKTAKKKCEYCHSSQQKRLKFYQDFKDG